MPAFSRELEASLHRSLHLANGQIHEYADISHLLLALLDDPEASEALHACGADFVVLHRDLRSLIDNYPKAEAANLAPDAKPTASFQRVIQRAHLHVQSSGRDEVTGANVLVAIMAERNEPALQALENQDITRYDLVNFISHGITKRPTVRDEAYRETVDDHAVLRAAVPHQTPAPVRVEERDGKIVLASVRLNALHADEVDFDRWRRPVADRLNELLDSDLGPGTNHSRLRKRLLALSEALEGAVDDVKANQFRLGYRIESLGDLVSVYRDAKDDMPDLNAAVFADVNRLHIQLMLGISKLVAWQGFQQSADEGGLHEGEADVATVGEALNEAVRVLEHHSAKEIVDPDLPYSFRWIREAIVDPIGRTKRMVFGAVKSLENVVVFLGQVALRTGKETIENVGQQISKGTAALLLSALGLAALKLSGALPTTWVWLQPLLDAVAKLHGG